MVDTAQRRHTAVRLSGWTAVLVALLIWAVAFAVYVGRLALDHSAGDLGCEYPAGSSNYGHASWQWWYPGTRCTYTAANTQSGPVPPHVDRPSWLSGAAAVGLIVWPTIWCAGGVAVALRRRSRPRPAPEDALGDDWPWAE